MAAAWAWLRLFPAYMEKRFALLRSSGRFIGSGQWRSFHNCTLLYCTYSLAGAQMGVKDEKVAVARRVVLCTDE